MIMDRSIHEPKKLRSLVYPYMISKLRDDQTNFFFSLSIISPPSEPSTSFALSSFSPTLISGCCRWRSSQEIGSCSVFLLHLVIWFSVPGYHLLGR